MSLILSKCIEFNEKRKICIAIENGKKYVLINDSDLIIRKVKIDGCLPQNNNEKRCDFLMNVESIKRVFFIELKGGDLVKAVNQITSSIDYLKKEFVGYQIEARIIGSRDVPNLISDPNYVRLAKRVLPTNGEIIRATNKIYKESI